MHVAIDDAPRIAFSSVHTDETGRSACQSLLSALRDYRSLGITVRRLLTDNGSCYRSCRFRRLCECLGITHERTRPYTPRTNGKAERFIQTALREWAYARSYRNSSQRARELPRWMHYYNWHRQHAGIDYQCPINTLGINMNNLLALHSPAHLLTQGCLTSVSATDVDSRTSGHLDLCSFLSETRRPGAMKQPVWSLS